MRKSLLSAVIIVALPTFGWAQTAAERDTSTVPENSNANALSEIIVTAQRRSERLVDVPITVDAIGQQEIATEHITKLSDLGQAVTSLRFEGNAPAFQPTLRGIGTLDQGAGVDSSVAVYVDGVYLANNYGMYFDLPNVANIEVLKGPQGTLFGRNATGGAILITTVEPSDTYTGNITATHQSYADNTISGYLSGPITQAVTFGLSATDREGDGYTRNIATGSDKDGRIRKYDVRPDLLVHIGDDFKFRLTYEHNFTLDNSTLPFINGDGYNGIGVLNRLVPGLNALISTQFGETAENVPPENATTTDSTSLSAEWNLGPHLTLKSITSYSTDDEVFAADADGTNLSLESVAANTSNRTFSQEFTLNGQWERFNWVGGFYYFNDVAAEDDRAVIGPLPALALPELGATLKDVSVTTNALAGFLDGTYEVGGNVFLSVGARLSTERKVADSPELPPSALIPVTIPATHEAARWTDPTPRAAIRYQLDSNTNVYGSFSQGFKSGAFTGFPPNLVQPEHLNAYEIGVKHSSLRFDISAAEFLYHYRDAQVTIIDLANPTGQTLNAGRQRNYGTELEMNFRPTDDWQIAMAGGYLKAIYTSFVGASTFVKGSDAGTFNLPGWLQFPGDATGTMVPRSPEWTGNLSTTYNVHVGTAVVRLSGNIDATSYFYMFPNNGFRQPGYAKLNFNGTYITPDKHWEVTAFVTNATSRHYAMEITDGPVDTVYYYAPPRIFGGSVSFRY